jgi:coenzyme F420-reducing hydrogenase beta subunit
MIKIKDKVDCCGCASCVQTCPQKCISFTEDREGFRYPKVNKKDCIDCGLCEKVCPIIQGKNTSSREPLAVFSAKNKDEHIRIQSSSGGVFTLLAEKVIRQGGVVLGARFDERWEVVHDYTETLEGLSAFRGSKYVQSRIEDNYQRAKTFLQEGRHVLFSGTPCQIAGLRRFMKKDYENLLCVDFVCHGVPSPKVWRNYLKNIVRQGDGKNSVSQSPFSKDDARITSISFREKFHGWKKYSFAVTLSKATAAGEKNTVSLSHIFYNDCFMQLFLQNVILRPSCYDCQFRRGRSGSDITIGDFWGIDRIKPQTDDDKGVSLVIINTEKGREFFPHIQNTSEQFDYLEVCKYNPSLVYSSKRHLFRAVFFFFLPYCDNFEALSNICLNYRRSLLYRIYVKAKGMLC